MFIIESKSVTEGIRVRPDGGDGDEWSRVFRGRETGMASPILQARRQSKFLQVFLDRRRERLLGRLMPGLRTLGRAIGGSEHRGFGSRLPPS